MNHKASPDEKEYQAFEGTEQIQEPLSAALAEFDVLRSENEALRREIERELLRFVHTS